MPLLGVIHHLYLLFFSKKFVNFCNTEEHIDDFLIDYMFNPTLHANKVFIEQVEKFINDTFGTTTKPAIKYFTKKIIPVFYHHGFLFMI